MTASNRVVSINRSFRPARFCELQDKVSIWVLVGPNAWGKAEQIENAQETGDTTIIEVVTGDPLATLDGGGLRPLVVTPKDLALKDWRQKLLLAGPDTQIINIEGAGEVEIGKLYEVAGLASHQAHQTAEIRINGNHIEPAVLAHYRPEQEIDASNTDADGTPHTPDELARLRQMNAQYTHVLVGGKNRVVTLKPCPVDGMAYSFESLAEFRGYFLHQSKIGKRRAGDAWLSWPGKQFKPGGVGFYPDPAKCPAEVFNLYQGLAVTPQAGDATPYLEHLEQVICAGDSTAFVYLLGWLAHLIQKPDEKPSVAVVLKSIEGTGKGTMFRPLKAILGAHAVQVNGYRQIAGRFNATVANKLLVFGDEVELTSQVVADRLKGLISEQTINLERKGIDPEPMPNYARFIFASNSEHMIQAGSRERRYLVLEPSTQKAQDKAYFDRLYQWLDAGGAAALLAYLLQYDLSEFDPRRAPSTRALIGEKLASLRPADAYLFGELSQPTPFGGEVRIDVGELVRRFIEWACRNHEEITAPKARSALGKAMGRLAVDAVGRTDRGGKVYELPSPEILRERFAQAMGHGVLDIFD